MLWESEVVRVTFVALEELRILVLRREFNEGDVVGWLREEIHVRG
jgi:hypothetical protein